MDDDVVLHNMESYQEINGGPMPQDAVDYNQDVELSFAINDTYPTIAGDGYHVYCRLLSDWHDHIVDALLTYVEESYDEIEDELDEFGEYLINLPSLNVKLIKAI